MLLPLFLYTLFASLALAAPANLRKRTFTVPAQGWVDPAKAIARAHQKWGSGLKISLPDFDLSGSGFHLSDLLPNKVPITQTVTYVAQSTPTPTQQEAAAPTSTVASAPYGNATSTQTASAPASTASNGKSGEVTASPEDNDKSYLSPVTVGGQTLTLNFDTGSADLWVFSASQSQSETAGHTAFDTSKSSTWSDYPGASWNITYGDGSYAYGTVGFDTVSVGGVSFDKQCVEIATDISDQFTADVQSDGLLGLGFSVVNTVKPQPQKTFFENVMSSLEQPLFTADLDKNAAGTYEFGRIDASSYVGELFYTPVTSENGYWEFESKSYGVGNSMTDCPSCSNAIADTGTSLMMMDTAIVTAYYAQVPSAQYNGKYAGYVYPCDAALPDFSVGIGNAGTATMKGQDMTYMSIGQNLCYGGLQNGFGGIQVLGDMFFKSYFAVFDGGAMRLGLARKS